MEAIYTLLIIVFFFWLLGHTGSWGVLVKSYKFNVWSGSPKGERTHVPIWSWSMVRLVDERGARSKTGVSNTVVSSTGLYLIQPIYIQFLVPSIYLKWSNITGYDIEGNNVKLKIANSNFVSLLIPNKYLPGFEEIYNKNRQSVSGNMSDPALGERLSND